MRRYEVSARVRCSAPPDAVWPLLADVGRWTTVREASVRVELLATDPPDGLRYRIVSGLPLRDHEAHVELVPAAGGTDIVWSHSFRARIPGSGGFLRTRMESQASDAATRLATAASVR